MKKSTALLLFIIADLFAVGIAYLFLCRPLGIICTGLTNRAEYINYTTNFYMGFGSIAIPTVHMIGLIENYLPRYFNKTICTRVIYASVIISLSLGFGTAATVKQLILNSGYSHCQGAAVHKKLLRIETYVLHDDTCRQLTLEKENRARAGLR